jgi:hypothetical protein
LAWFPSITIHGKWAFAMDPIAKKAATSGIVNQRTFMLFSKSN